MRRPLRGAELLADRLKGCRVLVVPIHVAQQAAELVERRPVDAAVLLEALLRPRPKLVEAPAGLGHTDNGNIEIAAFHHRLERREYFLVGQISRGPEKNQ